MSEDLTAPATEATLGPAVTTEAKQLRTQLYGCLAAATGALDHHVSAASLAWSPALEAVQRLRGSAEALAAILDDIDSASDRAQPAEGGKTSVARYRELIEEQLAKARQIVSADGDGTVRWHALDDIEWGAPPA